MAIIDLHTHSTASDGTLSPRELVALASESGLKGLALTDHDTACGLDEAIEAARKHTIYFVPGVEISTQTDTGALHLLGLHIDHHSSELAKLLEWLIAAREERNRKLIEKLEHFGVSITQSELKETAGNGATGRPHFATVMLKKGYVKNHQTAFKKYLGRNGVAHVERRKPPIQLAIDTIRRAGGVPVLAHPDQTHRKGAALEKLVGELGSIGLGGIEVYYTGYHESRIREYASLATKFHLVKSGGSDFHGSIKPGIRLGRGNGSLYVPEDLLEPLFARAGEIRKSEGLLPLV